MIKWFKESPKRNDVLESIVEQPIALQLDVKTRWDSMVKMLKCILKPVDSINSALLVLRKEMGAPVAFTDGETEILSEFSETLSTLSTVLLILHKKEVNILEGNAAIQVLMEDLQKYGESWKLTKHLHDELVKRFQQRIYPSILDSLTFFINTQILLNVSSKDFLLTCTLVYLRKR